MITVVQQCFVEGIESTITTQFDTIEEYIAYCEYHEEEDK